MDQAFTSARCRLHAPPGFPERPARLDAVLDGVADAGWPVREIDRHPECREAVLHVHSKGYLRRFEDAVARGDGLLDSADNPLSEGTLEAAFAAVECALAAADWVAEDSGRRAYVAVRPPGHHAEREMAMGFCFFANVAIAADHLVREHGVDRVAIFDFDVHHGNGTQHLLEERGDIFFASVHQSPFYPGTGAAGERGRGAGEGATLNVPLPAGCDDDALRAAVEGQILPALADFAPGALLISAGFDGWIDDPIGGWRLTEQSYSWLGSALSSLAAEHCDGRMVTLLEGGYSLEGLRSLTAAYLGAFDG